jgi:multiple sugar transport system permease protein
MAGSTSAVGGAPASSTAARRRWRETLTGWGFALPYVALFAVFTALPIVASLVIGFTDLRIRDILNPFNVEFVGLENYAALLGDDKFLKAAANTAVFVALGVPLTLGFGLLAATGLNQGVIKLRSIFRVGYYLPVVTSIVAIAVVWRLLLAEESGLLNGILGIFGADGPGWLTDERYALWSLIAMAIWRNMGFSMVIFLAGLQTIPADLYEAAEVDGAGRWDRFRRITVPMLRPTLLFAAVITGIGYVQFFEEPFVMTRGGPLDATVSVAMHAYDQFSFGNYGYTAAISYVLFLAVATLTFIQFRVFRSDD